MADSLEFSVLQNELLAIARRIYDAGREKGVEEAFAEIEGLISRGKGVHPAGTVTIVKPVHVDQDPQRLPYGAAKNAVRRALAAHPEGIKKFKIAVWIKRYEGVGLKSDTITEALKSLAKDDESMNPERGRWFPGPGLDWEKLGVAPPNSDVMDGIFAEDQD